MKEAQLVVKFDGEETSHTLIFKFIENKNKRDGSVVWLVPRVQASE